MSVPTYSCSVEDCLDTSLIPKNDYLWKHFGFSRESNPDLLNEIIPSDSESLCLRDLLMEDDADDTDIDPYKSSDDNDSFYNECPFYTINERKRKRSDETDERDVTIKEKQLSLICISLRFNSGLTFMHGFLNVLNSDGGEDEPLDNLAPKLTGLKFDMKCYCVDCSAILNFDGKNAYCKSCRKRLKMDLECCFMSGSLTAYLKDLVNSNLYPLLCKKHNGSDVTSSTMYQEMSKKMGKADLSLQWNISKMKVSVKGSTEIMCLLQVMVNELPYLQRINNVFLCGFRYGINKPMNGFLDPFIGELIDLRVNGLTCTTYNNRQPITIKFHTLFCIVDTDIRASILNTAPSFKSYNCSYCMKQDKKIPFSEDNLRTSDLHMKHCELAVKCGKIVKGVLGPSVVMLHEDINIVESFPPDYVDTCLLGVCKLIVTSWFDSAYRNDMFYLDPTKLKILNEKLKNIKRPCEVTRIPVLQWNLYTASDWRNFVLYFSQHCLNNLLPDNYYKHWMSLVKALHLFSKSTITEEIFQDARTHFNYFLQVAYTLYGSKIFLSHENLQKLHQLKHLPHFIQRYGALWAWSSFPYRRFVGMVHSQLQRGNHKKDSDHVSERVIQIFSEIRYVLKHSETVLTSDSPMLDEFINTVNTCRIKGCFIFGDGIRPLGQPTKVRLQRKDKKHLEKMCGITVHECNAYARFVLNDVLFHSYNYKDLKKIDNSVFKTKDGAVLRVVSLVKIEDFIKDVEKYVVKARKIQLDNKEAHWYEGEETQSIDYIHYSDIECKCFAIDHYRSDILLIIPFPNPFETH